MANRDWMAPIEDEEGLPFADILAHAAMTASATGYTMSDLAREWGISVKTLWYWADKLGIRFPRGVSELQRMSGRKGMANHMSRLTDAQVREMRRDRAKGMTYARLAEKWQCSAQGAWDICNERRRAA